MKEYRLVFNLDEIEKTAKEFLSVTKGAKHFSFYGGMGVGKTTFITTICKALGSDDLISSPSFAIINEYSLEEKEPIFHFDFYRIKDPVELLDIGFHEYCNSPAYCFIEWPEKGERMIPDDFIQIKIEEGQGNERIMTFKI